MRRWLWFGCFVGVAFALPVRAQTTCDMSSPDFNQCVERRCAELGGHGRLCTGRNSNKAPSASAPDDYPVQRSYYPPRTYTVPDSGYSDYGGYVPLEPSGTILIRPPGQGRYLVDPYGRPYATPGYLYPSAPGYPPAVNIQPLPIRPGGPSGVCYMGMC